MAVTSTSAISAASGLKLEDLLKVLLTELTHQDPFKPLDNKDFMGQIAQFAALDSTQQLNSNIEQLVALQAVNQTVGLIGHTVTATTDSGASITGKVIALALTNGVPRMTVSVGTQSYPGIAIGQLQQVF
jgi:flagellar basal-body rod modification protein FlgD